MKRLLILFFALAAIFISSCGKDDPSASDTPEEVEETVYSVVGVWRDGNKIVSFDADGFYCCYFGDKFIDNGYYKQTGNESVVCDNYYYNRYTTFSISSIDDNRMSVTVTSKDVYGEDLTRKLSLVKTDIEPTKEKHPLTAKSWTFLSNRGNVTMNFVTNDTGTKTCASYPESSCPLKFFYVYINGYAYVQFSFLYKEVMIGGWTDEASSKEIRALKIRFDSDGSMSFIGDSSVL